VLLPELRRGQWKAARWCWALLAEDSDWEIQLKSGIRAFLFLLLCLPYIITDYSIIRRLGAEAVSEV
jgi:hypothetical protein